MIGGEEKFDVTEKGVRTNEFNGGGIKAAIFDVDGTLLDSMPIWEDAGERYLKSVGIAAGPELGKILFPMSLEEAAVYMKEEYKLPYSAEEIVDGTLQVIEQFYREEVLLKEGAASVLAKMKAQKIRIAAATSGNRELVEAAFTRLGIRNYFEKIFTCTEVGAGKSQPDIYLRAAKSLGAVPEETLVFEDALHAMETAKNAGFPVVGVYDKSSEMQSAQIQELCDVYMKEWEVEK